MANINHSDKSVNSLQKVIFDEKALLYDEESLPEAGKTPICVYPPPSIPSPSQQACTFRGPKYSNC